MPMKDIFSYSIQNLYMLKKGMIQDAIENYGQLKQTDLKLDQVFYNILINGLMKQRAFEEAY